MGPVDEEVPGSHEVGEPLSGPVEVLVRRVPFPLDPVSLSLIQVDFGEIRRQTSDETQPETDHLLELPFTRESPLQVSRPVDVGLESGTV